ncbi:hypothetical protein [Pseudomonas sp.]|uniref:hypothetical protein n=1 Tax=Pseudomonas sp. TaxID=306 RepID=UPI003BB13DC1
MKDSLAWIAAECTTVVLTLGAVAMALAALLNLLEISSIFSTWFESSYVPALLALGLYGSRYISKLVALHFLYDDDEDATAPLTNCKPVQRANNTELG